MTGATGSVKMGTMFGLLNVVVSVAEESFGGTASGTSATTNNPKSTPQQYQSTAQKLPTSQPLFNTILQSVKSIILPWAALHSESNRQGNSRQ